MPFVSVKDKRELEQSIVPFERSRVPGFGETFNAALGLVFDENLSISGGLNREGHRHRNAAIDDLIRSGSIDPEEFTSRHGIFNYSLFARTKQIEGIKTDEELKVERNKILEQRRGYAEDTIAMGSGLAQFLGAANAYALDPINVLTLGAGGVVTGAKSMTALSRSLLTARNTAAITAATELAIQPLVYQHKQDIESPYSAGDALLAISTAAVGGGILGGITGGISGYLKSFRKAAEPNATTPELRQALENVERMESVLESAPEFDPKAARDEFILTAKAEILGDAGERLSRGERKLLEAEALELRQRINRVEDVPEPIKKGKGVKARIAKKESITSGTRLAAQERGIFQERLDIAEARLARSNLSSKAEADLSRLEQGIIPDGMETQFKNFSQTKLVEHEAKFLNEIEVQRLVSDQPSRKLENYEEPPPRKSPDATTTPRQRELLQNRELTEEFNRDMEAFNALEKPIAMVDDEIVDANAAMKSIDEELEGLESVMVCAIA